MDEARRDLDSFRDPLMHAKELSRHAILTRMRLPPTLAFPNVPSNGLDIPNALPLKRLPATHPNR